MKRFILPGSIVALVILGACASKDLQGQKSQNLPPTVWLSAAPPEGSTGKYTVHLYWGGWDPDGQVARYEYLISDNKTGIFNPADTVGVAWAPVEANDSTFTFSADELVDTLTTLAITDFTRSHTFFIRAVDEEGRRSVEPALPVVHRAHALAQRAHRRAQEERPQCGRRTPPIATFRWTAFDYVDGPALVAGSRFGPVGAGEHRGPRR